MQNRAMIFVDGGNLISGWVAYCKENGHVTKNLDGRYQTTIKLSYQKLLALLCTAFGNIELIRPYFFDGLKTPDDANKNRFLDMLRHLGFTIETKLNKYKIKCCPHCQKEGKFEEQKGVDVSLATNVLGLAFEDAYDIAIIVSGDGDYEEAVRYIKRKGKNVWIVSFRNSLSDDLRKIADKTIILNDHFHKLGMASTTIA